LQAAVEALIAAVDRRGPLLHARVGMLRALNHGVEPVYSDRKEKHSGKRKLRRDEQSVRLPIEAKRASRLFPD
jgi:hypothetical protein